MCQRGKVSQTMKRFPINVRHLHLKCCSMCEVHSRHAMMSAHHYFNRVAPPRCCHPSPGLAARPRTRSPSRPIPPAFGPNASFRRGKCCVFFPFGPHYERSSYTNSQPNLFFLPRSSTGPRQAKQRKRSFPDFHTRLF